MDHSLHLTKEERTLFDALPSSLKEGWKVTEEKRHYEDSDLRRQIRIGMMRVNTAELKNMKTKLQAQGSQDDVMAILKSVDWSDLPEGDQAELLFVIGPSGLGEMITMGLQKIESDEDVDLVARLSITRAEMFEHFAVAA